MANLTLTIEDEVLARARTRAVDNGTSVNALVRDYLASFAGEDDAMAARRELVESAKRRSGSSGPEGRTWTRDELYDRN